MNLITERLIKSTESGGSSQAGEPVDLEETTWFLRVHVSVLYNADALKLNYSSVRGNGTIHVFGSTFID